ncbi:uncharacterized protein N7498_004616 [Penicillium cinerascens]|uniref:C2H2-type domain-containing protein n=1 Tax=Penicillium cinerascens TaxID=70096 RepID=A0A9W9MM75_9EURO|nr:uncharacterized protein N7498_004616 [Penicillium cinerascens]KAJ5203737.1 hypothetical protein N7498_004616 [Penicillium cinerascens]
MDLSNLLQGSAPAPKPYTDTYTKRSAPLSPPVEELKCSLPSISTLLEGADGHAAKRQRMSPQREHKVQYDVRMPPTPPLRPGSGSGHHTSPSESLKDHRSSISSTNSHMGPYASPAPSVSSYTSHTSPVEAPAPQTIMYYRPQTATIFAPSAVPAPMPQQAPSPSLISPVTPAWQHHHYFPPSSTTPYQQNHDRYICRTCHKAFSRPSSLRIHSHSHTGEKPFRCTHAGCGKAFSVRSNMKRHERGCHSGRPVPATALVV